MLVGIGNVDSGQQGKLLLQVIEGISGAGGAKIPSLIVGKLVQCPVYRAVQQLYHLNIVVILVENAIGGVEGNLAVHMVFRIGLRIGIQHSFEYLLGKAGGVLHIPDPHGVGNQVHGGLLLRHLALLVQRLLHGGFFLALGRLHPDAGPHRVNVIFAVVKPQLFKDLRHHLGGVYLGNVDLGAVRRLALHRSFIFVLNNGAGRIGLLS